MELRESLRKQEQNRLTGPRGRAADRHALDTADPAQAPPGPRQRLRRALYERLLDTIEGDSGATLRDVESVRYRVRRVVQEGLAGPTGAQFTAEDRQQLEDELVHEVGGLGPIGPLFADPTVSDILVNGPHEVWVDRFGRLERTGLRFDDEAHLRRVLDRLVSSHGRRVDEASPLVDARLPDGSRVHAVVPPLARQGSVVSIRRFRHQPFSLGELQDLGSLSPAMAELLRAAVEARLNLLICGGAASGKTTLLNVLAAFVPAHERVVTIEETAELRIEHPHVVPLEGRLPNIEGRGEVSLRTLVRNALRMRADRIVVGEVRGPEVLDMLQAMNVGHDGSMTTVHANDPDDAMRRLELLALMGGELPARAVRDLVGSAFHLVAHMARLADGSRRMTSLREVTAEGGEIVTRELFRLERDGGLGRARHVACGRAPRFLGRLVEAGLHPDALRAPEPEPSAR